jgi:hypothetical protein
LIFSVIQFQGLILIVAILALILILCFFVVLYSGQK